MGCWIVAALLAVPAGGRTMDLSLNLRRQIEEPAGSGKWRDVVEHARIPAVQTAIVICDMWDHHWCAGAERRCGEIAKRMVPVIEAARAKGVFIVHAPSDCMDFYRDAPQRNRMREFQSAAPPVDRKVDEPPLPIDDSDGGCDDVPQCKQGPPWPWTRENATLKVAPEDGITDRGQEVYNALRARGIRRVLIMGVHTNMCVLGRSFAIRQMVRWGVDCALVRDLTDTMYNPRMRPQVSHEQGTELVIRHIERYLCPTVASRDLIGQR